MLEILYDFMYPLIYPCLISLTDGNEVWVSFKYERLPNICYWCGRLTHDDRDCDPWIKSEGALKPEQRAFGPYLRAPPFVVARKNVINVPGFYAEKKKANHATSTVRTSGQPP